MCSSLPISDSVQSAIAMWLISSTSFYRIPVAPGARAPLKMEHVTIAAELSGWRRFGPADEWLKRNMQIAKGPKPELLRTMFSRFIDERRQAMGGAAMSQQEKDALFQQFQSWENSQTH